MPHQFFRGLKLFRHMVAYSTQRMVGGGWASLLQEMLKEAKQILIQRAYSRVSAGAQITVSGYGEVGRVRVKRPSALQSLLLFSL